MPHKHKQATTQAQKDKLRSKRKYVRVADRTQGLPPEKRAQSTTKNGNQWVTDPRQDKFVEAWLTPSSPTFGNAYQSALTAGYSKEHSKNITTNALSLEWVKEAKGRLQGFNPEHTVKLLQDKALHAKKDSDQIRALEIIARIQGMFIDRSIQQIDVQFTNAVPRPTEVIDQQD